MNDKEFQKKLVEFVEEAAPHVSASVALNSLLSAACDIVVLEGGNLIHLIYMLTRHYDAAKQAYMKRQMQ